MPKKLADVNIEFTHIYINESFNSEHETSSLLAKKKIEELVKAGNTVCSTILIDDYNPTESFFVEKDFLGKLEDLGIKPDFVAYEAKLVLWVEKLLESMTGKLHRQYFHYFIKKGKAPCSLLVAIWHLIRLGAFELDHPTLIKATNDQEIPFVANKIVTILPHRYEAVENRAKEIIASTPYKESLDKMEHIFF